MQTPAPLTRDESDAFAARIAAAPEDRRFGLWALELRATGPTQAAWRARAREFL